jgi:hypothetical protein
MPRQYLLQSVTPAPRRENPSVFRRLWICRDMYCPIFGVNPDSGLTCTILLRYHEPLYSTRLPALRQTNFGLSPVPYRGNVVAWVNCSERTLSDHQCHLKTTNSFLLHLLKNHFWKHFSGVGNTPRFLKAFSKFSLSVPNPRVLAPLEVSQRLCC